jgi:glycosyltransferase involved in cell wall biosynthesis
MSETAIILQQLPTAKQVLRIAVVTETYPPEINGVAMTIGRMVTALQQRDHQIQLIRPKQNAADSPSSGENFEEVLRPAISIPRYDGLKMGLPAKAALLRLWAVKRPDLVHIATEGPLGWSALAAANKLRITVTTDFHTNFHSYSQHYGLGWLRKPIVVYLRKFHNKALCTMVPTEGIRRELAAHGYGNLVVVARGVDTALFSPERRSMELRQQWGAAAHDPVAIYVGRIAVEKNLPLVISTFEEMRRRQPRAKLVLVGDGPERAALQARFPEFVFCGMRTGTDLAAHYASADAFLFPSTTETYGNVTMEAMASGLAVVAYNYAAAEEHIRHNINGLLADFDDGLQFIRLAAELVVEPERMRALGRNARRTAETIRWDGVYDRFEQVLLNIVKESDRHGSEACVPLASN